MLWTAPIIFIDNMDLHPDNRDYINFIGELNGILIMLDIRVVKI